MTTGPVIVPLHRALDPALVGGKAVNLARMLDADLPVPDGFVVTTVAFNAGRERSVIPEPIAEQIRSAYADMGSPLVAVRSSATAEDMAEASMAGQYETYLNIGSPAVSSRLSCSAGRARRSASELTGRSMVFARARSPWAVVVQGRSQPTRACCSPPTPHGRLDEMVIGRGRERGLGSGPARCGAARLASAMF
jgi:hypothetical protein